MSITIEQLNNNIQEARRQEARHRDDAAACAGAAQAYEQLLSQLIQTQRAAKPVVPPLGEATTPHVLEKAIKKAKK